MIALLTVEDLAVEFRSPLGTVRAVDGVDFEIAAGETVGLVGESGCGKSTIGKAIVGLVTPKRGEVRLEGTTISGRSRRELRPYRRHVQMIFQDPYGSLNPRLTVGRIIEEPLIVHGIGDRRSRSRQVADLMRSVGLHPDAADRYPHEFSGGQRQRIGIARALALGPRLIVCDEPVSALDVSVQAQVVNLLNDLQRQRGLSYLLISHDLSVVQHVARRILVMYLGRILESAPREQLWERPLHPYTRGLIAAVPVPDPQAKPSAQTSIQGEVPSPVDPPAGCRFRTRCPFAAAICAEQEPALNEVEAGRLVACHFVKPGATGAVAEFEAKAI